MSSTGAQGYSSFYQHIAISPELGNFRRFGAYWAKRVHDETAELLACIDALDEEIEGNPHLDAHTVLDCPKRIVQEDFPRHRTEYDRLYDRWDKYETALMKYGKILCMSERIMNLPTQDKFNTEKLLRWKLPYHKPLFDQGEFVPTGEEAKRYQGDPAITDTCAWRNFAHDDYLTNRFLQASPWIDKQVLARWRRYVPGGNPTDLQFPSTLHYKRAVKALDTVTCALASIILAITVIVLKVVRPLTIRILITAIFGTLFAIFLKTMAGSLTRGEVFAATAAFYAVAVVFLSNTSSDCACR